MHLRPWSFKTMADSGVRKVHRNSVFENWVHSILEYCKHFQLNPIESLNSEIEKRIIKDIEEGKEYNFEAENYLCPSCGNFPIDGLDECDKICLSCYINSKHGVFDAIIFKVVKKAIDAWNPYCLLPEAPKTNLTVKAGK